MHTNGLWLITSLFAIAASTTPAAAQEPASRSASAPDTTVDALIRQLGDESYTVRDEATRALIARGGEIQALIRNHIAGETDLEVVYRLRHILDNIVTPPLAVLVVRTNADTRLSPGDVITHLAGRRVRNSGEFAQRLSAFPRGAVVRFLGRDGPGECGPIQLGQIDDVRDFVEPRGEVLARVLRLYADGYAEKAYTQLSELGPAIPPAELSSELRARLAFVAGDSSAAFGLLGGGFRLAQPISRRGGVWTAPSPLDLAGPGKAPLYIELRLLNEGGPEAYATENDPDLRIQRVLVPAHRYVDALVQAAELWNTKYRHELEDPAERTQLVSGNQLAVASWMLHDLGLLSESCRLIEPRSKILRQTDIGRQKWVRVDLDAWIPYLSGDLTGAIESSYEAALDVLRQPPQPGESDAIIRNPLVAARIAYFLYQSPEDRRVEDALSAVGQPLHPALVEYVRWMLAALGENNETLIRRHLLSVLPKLTDEAVEPLAHQAALLEYVRERPDADVLSTARQRIFQSPAGPSRDFWLAVADALVALNAGRPAEAAEALKNLGDRPEVAALRSTTEFLTNPPASAASFPALEKVRLAVPVGRDGGAWIVLDGQRQLRLFDSKLARLTPIAKPDPSWFPSPLTWPWLSREPVSGRVWTYSRRRVLELTPNAPKPFRCSISSPEIAAFDRDLSGQFTTLAEAVDAAPRPAGENSEFLRSEIQSHAESMADPDLPELGLIEPLPQDPRIVHVAMRGGPHLLINARTGKAWTSRWLTEKLGLTQPLTFVAQALWEKPQSAGQAPPIVLLLSNQGLIRFDTGSERVEQIPLPISPPFPALIPENAPYPRRDPDFAYFALPPEAGGRVFRLEVAGGVVTAVDMINESLPDRYYDAMSRAEIRAEIDRRFRDRQLGSLEEFVADAVRVVAKWRSTPE